MEVPTANAVFYRSYSRRLPNGKREDWYEACTRWVKGLDEILHHGFTYHDISRISDYIYQKKVLPSGRWMWVGGTEWLDKPENKPGAYNCTSLEVTEPWVFGYLMELAMMGCGTGAVLTDKNVAKLPKIRRHPRIVQVINWKKAKEKRLDYTDVKEAPGHTVLVVGDSRQGWAEAYQFIIDMAFGKYPQYEASIILDLTNVRPSGEPLNGFGGVANPVKLEEMFKRVCGVISEVEIDSKLSPLQACLLIDWAAMAVVAGNIRRSAGMRQFSYTNKEAHTYKSNLWRQDESGNWSIDPDRDALRMANHTLVANHKPTYEEILESVTKQYYSGEGAIQYAPEALRRTQGEGFGLNPCGEICGSNFFCNLVEIHLNKLTVGELSGAFYSGGQMSASLLNHKFTNKRMQVSRDIDPIVGVSFTGLFDFFVKELGVEWLRWMYNGRPSDDRHCFETIEREYLILMREAAVQGVKDYCIANDLKIPTRITTVQPAGSKSLLTNASPGWHPPKANYYIRRITFAKNDPVALAYMELGYKVVPSQSDKDENGRLLDDPFDVRCTEWLVEIPNKTSWADDVPEHLSVRNLPIASQWGLYMQVQKHYTDHNTSATLEISEEEIPILAKFIYEEIQNDGNYISAAVLSKMDSLETFPRLPFEPITKERYEILLKEVESFKCFDDFDAALAYHDKKHMPYDGAAGCDSDKCTLPEKK